MRTAAPGVTAYTPNGTPYLFDAGALCLEFLTSGGPGELRRYDVLHTPEDLARWFSLSRLQLDPEKVRVSDAELQEALDLRTALWGMGRHAARGQALAHDQVQCVNNAAEHLPLTLKIHGSAAAWRYPASGSEALSTIARDAVDLFTGELADRIRECEAPECFLIFVDTSRPGLRRWCAKDSCGNRHKMRKLRARNASGGDTDRRPPTR
ncbi:CGNR zinc finger domain-containing protein [Actinacidiphila glaucinigra]|uniref:CGNR zinc finger domain-containing protein n=1 Tax=Actinacidiphila glaucinigra TaxID=235986 RepID=UPI002DDB105C|nr:CGNR zinc finger domain-containing protein [Actinacidiphila glaucinigra]WSD57734.1 ABATE domain-containing protein [Actinacidiphila glaucinigra]